MKKSLRTIVMGAAVIVSFGCVIASLANAAAEPAVAPTEGTTKTNDLATKSDLAAPQAGVTKRIADTSTAQLPAKVYAPQSQLLSWPMQVFVSRDLPQLPPPELTLDFGHAVVDKSRSHCAGIPATHVARNQAWTGGKSVDGQDSLHTGTTLIFELNENSNCVVPFFKPMSRAQVIIKWKDQQRECAECQLFASDYVYLGSAPAAIALSLLILVVIISIIYGIVRLGKKQPTEFFRSPDGRMSLSMAQMAIWTLAVGFVVVFELLIRLNVGEIPASLIVLMGASYVTTGISATLNSKAGQTDLPPAPAPAPAPPPVPPAPPVAANGPPILPTIKAVAFSESLVELLSAPDQQGGNPLSLSRAQMLFWTVIVIVMFLSKSLLAQTLWDVPWSIVALMGVSQLGYLGGKYGQQPTK